jgi:[ribosomal protein S5]-alanine N-acetyltransferase
MEFTLRPWQSTDLENLMKYANNERIARYMTNQFPHPFEENHAIAFIERANSTLSIILAIDINGRAVGGIGLHPLNDIYAKNAELGYWLAEPFWGQGIMSKAIEEMVTIGFERLLINRIFARPFGSNKASQKALENVGFKLEARIEGSIFKNGQTEDELIFARRKKLE